MNFGLADYTPTMHLGATACLRTSWVSDSSLICTTPVGLGAAITTIKFDGLGGTLSTDLSFDSPVPTHGSPLNTPVSAEMYSFVCTVTLGRVLSTVARGVMAYIVVASAHSGMHVRICTYGLYSYGLQTPLTWMSATYIYGYGLFSSGLGTLRHGRPPRVSAGTNPVRFVLAALGGCCVRDSLYRRDVWPQVSGGASVTLVGTNFVSYDTVLWCVSDAMTLMDISASPTACPLRGYGRAERRSV